MIALAVGGLVLVAGLSTIARSVRVTARTARHARGLF